MWAGRKLETYAGEATNWLRALDPFGRWGERGGREKKTRTIFYVSNLMDNHYHLLIETRRAGLNRALRYLNGLYTQAFNRRHKRVSHLFQGGFLFTRTQPLYSPKPLAA